MGEIKVSVVAFGDRRYLQMQYTDPLTGRKKTRSTGTTDSGEAVKAAGKWEAELREGRYHEPLKMTWEQFTERYDREVLSGLSPRSQQQAMTLFNKVKAILNPLRLRDLTAERISFFQATLREKKLSENSIEGYSAYLRAALNWAETIGLLPKAPKIQRPKRAKSSKGMKGRPITREEFERMLAKVEEVVDEKVANDAHEKAAAKDDERAASSWQHYLEGLWCSGLRLEESLELWWDRDDRLRVDLSGELPMLRIPAELEKGHKDRVLPMAPEFAEFLSRTPENDRTGRVFKPKPKRVHGDRLGKDWVSKIVSRIGKAANVKVNTDPRTGAVKYASAHDLRRSFGERWASRIMPQVLMELMRHESIETTLRYYVGRNAHNTAKVLWEAHKRLAVGNTFGNTRQNQASDTTTTEAAITSRDSLS